MFGSLSISKISIGYEQNKSYVYLKLWLAAILKFRVYLLFIPDVEIFLKEQYFLGLGCLIIHWWKIQNRVLSSVSGRIASSRFVADWLLIVIVYAVAGLLWWCPKLPVNEPMLLLPSCIFAVSPVKPAAKLLHPLNLLSSSMLLGLTCRLAKDPCIRKLLWLSDFRLNTI